MMMSLMMSLVLHEEYMHSTKMIGLMLFEAHYDSIVEVGTCK